jgi:hypothetical protein
MNNSTHKHHADSVNHDGHSQSHGDHDMHHEHGSLNRVAISATIHCLTGCAIGEVLGMVIGTAIGLGIGATIALAVTLAFISGFGLTTIPLLRHGLPVLRALKLAFLADAASITIMEIVDNAIMLVIPGAMTAGLDSFTFWGSLVFSLLVAGVAAFPVNRWLIRRGSGHAVVHKYH